MKFWIEDILYVYITWLLELFTFWGRKLMLTKTGQSLWALTKTGQSLWALTKTGQFLWGLTSCINCFRQYSNKNFGLRYQRPARRVRIHNIILYSNVFTWAMTTAFSSCQIMSLWSSSSLGLEHIQNDNWSDIVVVVPCEVVQFQKKRWMSVAILLCATSH